MPKMTVSGLDELIRQCETLGKRPEGLVKRSIYKGAEVMADALKSAISSIPTDEGYGTKINPKGGITAAEKAGLISGMGISKMEAGSGTVSLSIGFHGNNAAAGVKNATVMRRVESGTSIMRKHPTIRPTANKTKAAAFAAMQKQFQKDIQELFNS